MGTSLHDWGLDPQHLVAGFAGGIVHAFVFKQSTPLAVVASVLTGTLTANYLSPAAVHYIGGWLGDGGSAFIVGLTAMSLCQGLAALVKARVGGGASDKEQTQP